MPPPEEAKYFKYPSFDIPPPPKIPLPPNPFTSHEEIQLAEIYSNPLVRRHLEYMTWNSIIESAQIPLPADQNEVIAHALRSAYAKGSLSILYTLLSIRKPDIPRQTSREPT